MTSITSAREQFDRQARHYNERWASWSDETLRRMLDLAGPQPEWRVLDVATGAGFTALAFAPHIREVVGTDVSTGMLAQAAKRSEEAGITNVTWQEADAARQPFADNTFELVTVRIAPHHFPDVSAFLWETRRVLKPSGALVLGDTSVPDGDAEAAAWQNAVERERDPSHVANLSAEQWRALCEAAGLSVTDLDHTGGAIRIALGAWLETAGCTGERADRVRRMYADAPESARRHFNITVDETGETHFAWQRVVLRALKQ